MDLEAVAIEVRDLEGEGVVEPESQARDSGKGHLMVQGGGRLEKTAACCTAEDGGKPVCGLSAYERQGGPIALEDMLREEAHATRADAHRSWGEAIDVCAGQEIVLQLLFGEHRWRCARELRQQADFTARGVLGTLSLAAELQGGNHLWA
jgi:hypothetical protein